MSCGQNCLGEFGGACGGPPKNELLLLPTAPLRGSILESTRLKETDLWHCNSEPCLPTVFTIEGEISVKITPPKTIRKSERIAKKKVVCETCL